MTVLNAQGSTFTFANISGTPVTVGGIASFTGFDGTASDIDVTTLASVAKEYRQGLQDFGKFTIQMMRDPADAGQIELALATAAQATRACVLTLPSGHTASFTAYVKSLTSDGGVDAIVKGTSEMKITGAVTWT